MSAQPSGATLGVSVAMCTYEGERFIGDQLESILAQYRPPDELVICDDCSTDATLAIAGEFAKRAPFPVRLVEGTTRLGVVKNFERAIVLCEGDAIALSDQDDVWHPDKLRLAEAILVGAPRVGAVFSDAEVVDEELRSLGYTLWDSIRFRPRDRRRAAKVGLLRDLLGQNVVQGATLTFRTTFRDVLIPIPDVPLQLHDHWAALCLASVTSMAMIDRPLIRYRRHPGQRVGPPDAPTLTGRYKMELRDVVRNLPRTDPGRYTDATERFSLRGGPVIERLACCGYSREAQAVRRELDRRLVHYRTRAELQKSVVRRAPTVLGELFGHRYHDYSRGFRSAAKDLFVGGRFWPR